MIDLRGTVPLTTAEECEYTIYKTYQDVIAPLIADLEVLDNEYPIEIFNEIRSMFLHLSRYRVQKQEKDAFICIRHLKRAVLDCYKYLCVSISDKISGFRLEYRDVDLSLADNGKFLPKLDELEHKAKAKLIEAKTFEITQANVDDAEKNDDEIYRLYEVAYNEYEKLNEFLDNSGEAIAFASANSKKAMRMNVWSLAVGIIGMVVGIVGVVISLWK